MSEPHEYNGVPIERILPAWRAQVAKLSSEANDLHAENARLRSVAEDNKRETEATRIENARLKEQMEAYIEEAQTLGCFMRRFDWIIYSHNCKGGTERTHKALDELRANYLEWRNPGEKEQGL